MSKSMVKSEQLLEDIQSGKGQNLNQNIHPWANIITFIYSDEGHYFIWRL